MANPFYNPYHFVPLNNKAPENTESFENIKQGITHVTHQLWKKDLLSGSIFVALTNTSPLIVGKQKPGSSTIKFYKQRANGNASNKEPQPTIPANSLRGSVVNVAECIADSSMRVLADAHLSVRMLTHQALSQIGIVRRKDNKWFIEPITFPTLKTKKKETHKSLTYFRRKYRGGPVNPDYQFSTGSLTWESYLKWYIPAYNKGSNAFDNSSPIIHDDQPTFDCSHAGENNEHSFVYILDPNKRSTKEGDPLFPNAGTHKLSEMKDDIHILSGLRFDTSKHTIISSHKHSTLTPQQKKRYVRSILFWQGRLDNGSSGSTKSELMSSKRHAYAIPYDKTKQRHGQQQLIPIPDEVAESFENMLEANKETLLFPKGWEEAKNGKLTTLMDGDIYYFSHKNKLVDALSLSSIGRKPVTGNSVYGVLQNSGLQKYLPLGTSERKQHQPSLDTCEQLFGVVEQLPETKGNNINEGQALASRVRFHDAIPCQELHIQPAKPLPALDSPKPPSPSMYFHQKNGAPANKSVVTNPHLKFNPNGKKQYLVDMNVSELPPISNANQGSDGMKKESEYLNSSKDPSFAYKIDFDNLTKPELDLLLTSLGCANYRPDNCFTSRIGMGKPYGYGKCETQLLDVLFTSPIQRYSSLHNKSVYTGRYQDLIHNERSENMLQNFAEKSEDVALKQYLDKKDAIESIRLDLRESERLVKEEQLTAFLKIRKPVSNVQYPKLTEEGKIFEWFVENDNTKNESQGLGKLDPEVGLTPLSQTFKPSPKKNSQYKKPNHPNHHRNKR